MQPNNRTNEPQHIGELIRMAVADAVRPLESKIDALLQEREAAPEYLNQKEALQMAGLSDPRSLRRLLAEAGIALAKGSPRISRRALQEALDRRNRPKITDTVRHRRAA